MQNLIQKCFRDGGIRMVALGVTHMMIATASADDPNVPKAGQDRSTRAFRESGHVVKAKRGLHKGQLLYRIVKDSTLIDLQGSEVHTLNGGPFKEGNLPQSYPAGAALKAFKRLPKSEAYPVSIQGIHSRNILVLGGRIIGQQPRELPWRIMKRLYDGDGIRIEGSGDLIVDGAYVENVEDGFSPRGDGYWILRNSHMRYIRDDFVENDGLLSGEITNCLADGVFVFLSARPGPNADKDELDAMQKPIVKIRDCLVHLLPMPYDEQESRGSRGRRLERIRNGNAAGMPFKWGRWSGSVIVHNCIFRIDAVPVAGAERLAFPPGTYENVTIVWQGRGAYPGRVPKGVTVTREIEKWNSARTQWLRENTKEKGEDRPAAN